MGIIQSPKFWTEYKTEEGRTHTFYLMLDSLTDAMNMKLGNLQEMVRGG